MKNIFKMTGFCLLLVVILWKTDRIFEVKYGDGIYGMTKFYDLEDHTVDTLVLGSSHAFEDINTGVLWEDYGIAAYVLGGSIQPMWNTYYYLKEALKTQRPELIVLEAYCTMFDSDYIDDSRIIKNTFAMKWSKNKVDAMKTSVPQERWAEFLLSYIQYHTRYTELSKEDFLKNKGDVRYENWKGFGCNMATTAFPAPNVENVTERKPMSEKTEKYYRKTIELALEHNIPVLVALSPYAGISESEQAVFNTAGDIAKEYGVNFINYNLLYNDIGIDFSQDAADPGHLNYRGNQKYTAALGTYIMQHYTVTDRRENPSYGSWDADAEYIAAAIRNQEFREAATTGELAEKMQNRNYRLYVSVDDECKANEQNLPELFEGLQLPYVKDSSFWAVEDVNHITYAGKMDEDALHQRMDHHDLYISRRFDEDSQSYVQTVTLDRTVYRKVNGGVNILVYDTVTQSVVDCFGIQAESFHGEVIR